MKLIPYESRLQQISNDIWIIKIGLKMRNLRLSKFGAYFQTKDTIMIANFSRIKGFGRKDACFGDHDCETTLEFEILNMCLPREGVTKHLKA